MAEPTDTRPPEEPADRLPYEPPAVISEEIFETLALACGKHGSFQCHINGGNNS